jgi:uncharacterized repeat protein (TIGR01451 family)
MKALTGKFSLVLLAGMLISALLVTGCTSSTSTVPVTSATPAKTTSPVVIVAPAPTTAVQVEPASPTPGSIPIAATVAKPTSVTVTPAEDTNSIKSQHTFTAVVKEANGSPSVGAEVHWILNRFETAVGDIVSVTDPVQAYNDNHIAVAKTDAKGEAKMTITATRAGDTDVTVYVPGITDPAKHKVFAVKHWVDMGADLPVDAVNKIGTTHIFQVKVYKVSDGTPLAGVNVNWTITDDTPDLQFKGLAPAFNTTVTLTDAAGIATVTVQQAVASAGDNVIRADVVLANGVVLYSSSATKTWLSPSLNLLKEGPSTAKEDDTLTYTITVRNDGKETATKVQLVDQVPPGLTYVSSTPAGAVSGTTVTWNLGTLVVGANTKITTVFTAKTGGTWTNTVTATSAEKITATASAAVSITPKAKSITITKTGATSIYQTKTGLFTITVKNTGEKVLTNVNIADTIPAGLTYVSSTPAGAFAGQTVSWTFASLAAGASQTMTVTCRGTTIGSYTNTATVTTLEGATNTATAPVEVTAEAGVTVSLVDTTDPVPVGGQTTYTVTVINQGTIAVHAISITFTLPTQFSFAAATGPTGFTVSGKTITFTPLAVLNAGATVTFTVTVTATAAGNVVCSVTRSYTEFATPITLQEGTTIYTP